MKKILSIAVIFIIVFSMFSTLAPQVMAQETTLFSDDFESYTVGTLPSPPWEFWFNTNGEITGATYVSPTKSLRLLGSTGWATEAIKRFTSSSAKIGCEVYAKAESIGTAYESVFVGFLKRTGPTTAPWYASVTFLSDGKIYTHEGPIQSYVANVWYKIRIVFDRASNTYDVWIDDVLKASSVRNIYSDPYAIEGFAVASGWASVNCYFDNAKVFEIVAPPDLYFLPSGAKMWTGQLDTETILLSLSQQVVTASSSETITLTATYQVWSSGGPGIIKQAFFMVSWTPVWPPPSGYYIPLYNGQPGYYPGVTETRSFSITVPSTAGTYYLWFGSGAQYSMQDAVNQYDLPLSPPAHAKIVVSAKWDDDDGDGIPNYLDIPEFDVIVDYEDTINFFGNWIVKIFNLSPAQTTSAMLNVLRS